MKFYFLKIVWKFSGKLIIIKKEKFSVDEVAKHIEELSKKKIYIINYGNN